MRARFAGVQVNQVEIYAPVRKSSDGHYWAEMKAHSYIRDQAYLNGIASDKLLPSWAADNPVVRIGRFLVTEQTGG